MVRLAGDDEHPLQQPGVRHAMQDGLGLTVDGAVLFTAMMLDQNIR